MRRSSKQLIKAVKKHEAIWDMRSKDYKNNTKRAEAWLNVCKEMYSTWEELPRGQQYMTEINLKARWGHIRRYYKLEVEAEEPSKKTYIYAKYLSFLRPIFKSTQDADSENTSAEESDESEYVDIEYNSEDCSKITRKDNVQQTQEENSNLSISSLGSFEAQSDKSNEKTHLENSIPSLSSPESIHIKSEDEEEKIPHDASLLYALLTRAEPAANTILSLYTNKKDQNVETDNRLMVAENSDTEKVKLTYTQKTQRITKNLKQKENVKKNDIQNKATKKNNTNKPDFEETTTVKLGLSKQNNTKYFDQFQSKVIKTLEKFQQHDKDPDLHFLKGMLPDMRQLNDIQKLEFKSGMIQLMRSVKKSNTITDLGSNSPSSKNTSAPVITDIIEGTISLEPASGSVKEHSSSSAASGDDEVNVTLTKTKI